MSKQSSTFYILTQGCKINQYESQALAETWMARGAQPAEELEQADVVVINSCAVTDKAVQDLRKMLRRCRRKNPWALMTVTGCAAQMCPQDMGDLSDVQGVIAQEKKAAMADWPPGNWPASVVEGLPNRDQSFPALEISRFPRARPVVKVEDGCSHGCTYCIVPLTRGPAKSRPAEEVAAETERLLINGYRELIISGINLAQYQSQKMDFWDLIHYLQNRLAPQWQGTARLRLSSLDPSQLGSKALTVLADSKMLCPHLHLSMQSASPKILQAMGRSHYHPEQVGAFVHALRGVWPLFALGGDFLVGFPGETEEDRQGTEKWFTAQPFTYAHVFAYSPRPGTPAAQAKKPVQAEVKKERSQRLRELAAAKGREFARHLLAASSLKVLVEEENPGRGRCEYYVPCSFVRRPGAEVRDLVSALPVQVEGASLAVQRTSVMDLSTPEAR